MPDLPTEPSVTLLTTPSTFEAETIAAALRDRGVSATVVPAPHLPTSVSTAAARVVVLESHESSARAALDDLKTEAAQIDWNAVDVGEPAPGMDARPMSRHRRALWTLTILLLPFGFVILSQGNRSGNPVLQLTGGSLLCCSAVIAGYLLFARETGVE